MIEDIVSVSHDTHIEIVKFTSPLITQIAQPQELHPIVQALLAKTHALSNLRGFENKTELAKALSDKLNYVINSSSSLTKILEQAAKGPGDIVITNQFNKDSQLDVYVSRLNSIKTLLPFDFYYLNYCNPSDVEYKTENVGEALTGDHIANTPFKVTYNLSKLIVQNDEKQDILGKAYKIFLKRAGKIDNKNIILTPDHIKSLMVELARLNVNDVVLDTCTGTGGFLMEAMEVLINLANSDEEKTIGKIGGYM